MKQHIAVFTLGLSLLTSCMTDSAYRKVENGFVADIRSGQAKAVKLEVISDDIIRVIASPDGKFSNQVNLIKDTKSLPAPSFQITTSGDTIIVSTPHRPVFHGRPERFALPTPTDTRSFVRRQTEARNLRRSRWKEPKVIPYVRYLRARTRKGFTA